MEWIVEKNCSNSQTAAKCMPFFQPYIEMLLKEIELNSLDYFVIADSNDVLFRESVEKYAFILGIEENVTQDGLYFAAGKTLCGINVDGRIHQAIVIKSEVWVEAAVEYAQDSGRLPEELCFCPSPSRSKCAIILHEIGHAVDGDFQFKISGSLNTKTQYDLRFEYDEYVKQTALSLWGEYFAESFACKRLLPKEASINYCRSDLLTCLASYSNGTDGYDIRERVYRILYFFMLWLATRHQQTKHGDHIDYSSIWQEPIIFEYRPLLLKFERAIDNLERDYPRWESYDRLNELMALIKSFFSFEHRRQLRIKCTGK